jgi:hypothetical protein
MVHLVAQINLPFGLLEATVIRRRRPHQHVVEVTHASSSGRCLQHHWEWDLTVRDIKLAVLDKLKNRLLVNRDFVRCEDSLVVHVHTRNFKFRWPDHLHNILLRYHHFPSLQSSASCASLFSFQQSAIIPRRRN